MYSGLFSSRVWATCITVRNLRSKQTFGVHSVLIAAWTPAVHLLLTGSPRKAGQAVTTLIRFIIHVTRARLRARTATDLHRASDSCRRPSRHALALGRSLTHPGRTTPPLSHRRGKEGRKGEEREGGREGGDRGRTCETPRGETLRGRGRGELSPLLARADVPAVPSPSLIRREVGREGRHHQRAVHAG